MCRRTFYTFWISKSNEMSLRKGLRVSRTSQDLEYCPDNNQLHCRTHFDSVARHCWLLNASKSLRRRRQLIWCDTDTTLLFSPVFVEITFKIDLYNPCAALQSHSKLTYTTPAQPFNHIQNLLIQPLHTAQPFNHIQNLLIQTQHSPSFSFWLCLKKEATFGSVVSRIPSTIAYNHDCL